MKSFVTYIAIVLFLSGCYSIKKEIREGKNGDAVANKIMKATGQKNWANAQIIEWEFQKKKHVWDRERKYHYVKHKDTEIWMSLETLEGVVRVDGEVIEGKKKEKALKQGYKYWANDSFWLNPFAKFFDEGTTRSIISLKNGQKALAVYYGSGGLTPGDTFVWLYDEKYMPTHWKLWVKIIPIKGYKMTWENWVEAGDGIKFSQLHESKFFTMNITNIQVATNLSDVFEKDPFEILSVK